jgi:hypothetical protein
MRRRLFTILSALSMLLCVTTGAWWVRSFYVSDTIGRFRQPDETCALFTECGSVLYVEHHSASSSYDYYFARRGLPVDRARTVKPLFPGMGYEKRRVLDFWNRPASMTLFRVSFGYVVLATLLFPSYVGGLKMWRRVIEVRRRHVGSCVTCGYDLRGTPERCPECGTAPAGDARETARPIATRN